MILRNPREALQRDRTDQNMVDREAPETQKKKRPQQGCRGGRGVLGLLIFETTTHPVTANTMIEDL